MMKIWAVCFLFLLGYSFGVTAQVTFEPGYFITDSGERIECLIKNEGWRDNPEKFNFKLTSTNEVSGKSIEKVKEFGLKGGVTFVRQRVQIEMNPKDVSNLTYSSEPDLKEETVFLKVLVDGKANLYMYSRNGADIFLYSVDDGEVKQLVKKRFRVSTVKVAFNAAYIRELREYVTIYDESLSAPDYSVMALTNYFVEYNTFYGGEISVYKDKSKGQTRLTPLYGFQSNSFQFDHLNRAQYDRETSGSGNWYGATLEYKMPFRGYSFGMILEPSIGFFNKTVVDEDWNEPLEIDFQRIELVIGMRYYYYLSRSITLYVTGFIPVGHDLSSTLKPGYGHNTFNATTTSMGVGAGLGVQVKRVNLEARYYHNRNTFWHYRGYKTELRTLSINLGFTIFEF